MKKILLITSAVCFLIAIITGWICSVSTGLIMTLVLGALIVFDIYLLKNDPRWWICILLLVLAFIIMTCNFSKLFKRNNMSHLPSMTQQQQNIVINNEKLVEEEIEEEFEQELPDETDSDVTLEVKDEPSDEPEPVVVTQVVEKVIEKEVPVEKVVEKEVPVEKIVEKEVIKEVPVVEYVEVEKEPETTTQTNTSTTTTTNTSTSNKNWNYTDPTVPNNGNYHGYGSYDPTVGYNPYLSFSYTKIEGDTEVEIGRTYTYVISGVGSISKSKLDIPEYVSLEGITGNKVKLSFEQTGSYWIGYGNATIHVEAYAD